MLDTSKQNEMSYAIGNNKSKMAWYTKDMYDRPISKDGINKWKDKLNNIEQACIEYYFSHVKYDFLQRYDFDGKKLKYKINWKYQVFKRRINTLYN